MHQRKFGRIWNEFLSSNEGEPYRVSVSVDSKGQGEIYVWPVDFPGNELALEFGEFLYQLRAALDSLIYETAVVVSGQDPPPNAEDLEFPIRPSETSFNNAARKIAPLADHHKVWIEEMQPYHREHRTDGLQLTAQILDAINDLARKDRHRGLRVIASWGANKNPQIDLPAGCELEWVQVTPDGPLERQGVVATFKIRNWTPDLQLHANPNCTIDVAVEDAPPPRDDEDTLASRTRHWIALVSLLIEGFENSLDGDPRSA
ncbi:MAG TPA: hypothetical protein VF250_05600 [Conexibacter sp.]